MTESNPANCKFYLLKEYTKHQMTVSSPTQSKTLTRSSRSVSVRLENLPSADAALTATESSVNKHG